MSGPATQPDAIFYHADTFFRAVDQLHRSSRLDGFCTVAMPVTTRLTVDPIPCVTFSSIVLACRIIAALRPIMKRSGEGMNLGTSRRCSVECRRITWISNQEKGGAIPTSVICLFA